MLDQLTRVVFALSPARGVAHLHLYFQPDLVCPEEDHDLFLQSLSNDVGPS